MRLVSPTCTTKPASDRYIVMLARNAVMPSSLAPVASATMFTCCSTMVGAGGGQPDHERDHPQVRRLRQHPQRLGAADAALVLDRRQAADVVAPEDEDDDAGAARQGRGAHQQQVDAADLVDQQLREAGAERAAEAGAAADEAEQPLGLARVVDVVGERPELADEQNAEDLAEQVQARPTRLPIRSGAAPRRPAAATTIPASVTGTTERRGSRLIARAYWCISTPISSPAASMIHGRLSAPKLVMNLDRVIGLRML